jgi:hypothetical protein
VSIDSLHLTVHADQNGHFLFRNLPTGALTITARYKGRVMQHKVTLDSGPDIESSIDIEFPPA